MRLNSRQSALIGQVRSHGPAMIEALAKHIDVTLQTVRRDAGALPETGRLARFHGGARREAAAAPDAVKAPA